MSAHYYEEGPPATGRKVLLAVPTYDKPDTSLTFSLARSREALSGAGIQSALLILEGNCHVDDARNSIVRDFLESDCTDLVFLDADVTWEPEGLVQLCQRECDIVGGVYPYRREGSDQMPVRLMPGAEAVDGLMEVEGLPTGFMKIRRHVLEKMAAARPWYFDKIYPTALVFNRSEPDEHHMRWGGDLDFCRRWREMGGKIYADAELRLGHVAKVIIYDSLGSHLRRITGQTLQHVIPRFRNGDENEGDYSELYKYAGSYSADAATLAVLAHVARKCQGPIIETGSGMSSVLMAALTDQKVYSLEHSEHYAAQTLSWAQSAGVDNLGICCAPMKDFWYDVDAFDLPKKFAFGFCDGPPRLYGTRMRFLEVFGDRCTVIVLDDVKSDHEFSRKVREWAEANGRSFTMLGRAALLQREEAMKEAA